MLSACAALTKGDVAFSEHMGAVVVAPQTALGATLVFEATG